MSVVFDPSAILMNTLVATTLDPLDHAMMPLVNFAFHRPLIPNRPSFSLTSRYSAQGHLPLWEARA